MTRLEVKEFKGKRLKLRLTPKKNGVDGIIVQGWYISSAMGKSNLHADGGEPISLILDTGDKFENLEEFSILDIKDYFILN